jgi:hypothetical protein
MAVIVAECLEIDEIQKEEGYGLFIAVLIEYKLRCPMVSTPRPSDASYHLKAYLTILMMSRSFGSAAVFSSSNSTISVLVHATP